MRPSTEMPVVDGLQFPSGIAIDDRGAIFLTECGLDPSGRPAEGRVLRLGASGTVETVAEGLRAPVTGLCAHNGRLYVSEGGKPGRISCVDPDTGARETVLDNLPAGGDYHTNTPYIHDGWLYFGQGAATNSGVVSWDPVTMPWIHGSDLAHDIPGQDVVLAAQNPEGPLGVTSAFHTYGSTVPGGTRLKAQFPCTSAVMRCRLDGTGLELVAWGLRNPFGVGHDARGRMLAIDLGMNDRGVRPVRDAASCLYEVTPGQWYGWPDFTGGAAVNDEAFRSAREGATIPEPLLTNHNELGSPAKPIVQFPVHSGPTKFTVDPASGDLLVALFGDKRPLTGTPGPKAGRKLVWVSADAAVMSDVAGPKFLRPIDLVFNPEGTALYVVDFGDYEIDRKGQLLSKPGMGSVWCLPAEGLASTKPLNMEAET